MSIPTTFDSDRSGLPVMTRLLFAWLTLALVPLLLVFKTFLNSDLLFLDSLMVDLFAHGGAWRDWTLTPAPAYFPDMLAYAAGYFILPGVGARVAFVGMVQALLLAWAGNRLALALRPGLGVAARTLLVLLVAAFALVAAHSGMWLFFNSTNNHFAALLFPLLCAASALRYVEDGRAGRRLQPALALVACTALGTMSTPVFTLSFTLPLLALAGLCLLVLRADRARRWLGPQVAALAILGHLLAALANKLLLAHDALAARVPFSVDAAKQSAAMFVTATRNTFAPDNLATFALALFVAAALAWLPRAVTRRPRAQATVNATAAEAAAHAAADDARGWRFRLAAALLLIAAPATVAGAIVSGGIIDPWGYRYFAFPIALGLVLWVAVLDQRGALASQTGGRLLTAALLALALAAAASVAPLYAASGRASVAEVLAKGKRGETDPVGGCIDRTAAKGFRFQAGLSDFWYARGVSYKTAVNPYLLQGRPHGVLLYHMQSLGPLREPQRYGFSAYNFAILRKSGTITHFNMRPDTIGKLMPPPAQVISCEGSDAELWLFEGAGAAEFDAFVKQQVKQLLEQETK